MFLINLNDDTDIALRALLDEYPNAVTQVGGRQVTGPDGTLTLLFTVAAFAVPAIKMIVTERIRSGRYRSVSYKGVKYQGYNASEVERIIKALKDDGHDV